MISPCAAAAITLSPVCELTRPSQPESLSSLSSVGGDVFWTSTDWHPELFELILERNSDGTPSGVRITRKCALDGAVDVEGIARDPLRGTVWVADEQTMCIYEHDPVTGKRLGTLDMPPVFKKFRATYGLESLSMRPDGLELWCANEEALSCDGPVSTREHGTTVRLARFTRKDAADGWHAAGQWAYTTDSIAGTAPFRACRSGLVDLCALEDGTLLALEREYSFKPLPSLRCRIYAVDRTEATDVSTMESLASGGFKPVGRKLLYGADTGTTMYEGLAAGPVQADGSRLLVLVSDGDKLLNRRTLVLRMAK